MKVKAESLAKRCEICHQNDHFDAVTNTCNRCQDVNYKDVIRDVKSIALPFFLSNLVKNPNAANNNYLNIVRWRKASILSIVGSIFFIVIRVAGFFRDKQIQEGIKRGDPEYNDLWCFYSYWGEYEVLMVLIALFAFISFLLAIYFVGVNLYKMLQDKRIW